MPGPRYMPGVYGGVSPSQARRKKNGGRTFPGVDKPLLTPPMGSYDPSIMAQLDASRRGLSDLREDTRTAGRWAKKDLRQSLFDTRRSWRRNRFDLGQSFRRENQKIRFQKQDLRTDRTRANEDFATRLRGVSRQFGQLASTQEQARNAAGTLEGGTAAAAASKRAENQRLAVAPIATAQNRMEQDFATKMGRVNLGQEQLRSDFATKLKRGRQDVARDRKLTKRDYGRDKFTRGRKLQRGIREQMFGERDLNLQMIDSARQRNPGVFSKYGKNKKGRKF